MDGLHKKIHSQWIDRPAGVYFLGFQTKTELSGAKWDFGYIICHIVCIQTF